MPILKSLLFLASLVLAQGLVEVDDVQLLVSTFYPPTRELRIAQEEKGLLCSACISFVNSLLHQLENGTSPEEVVNEVIGICKGLPASDIDDTVCEGIIPNYATELFFMAEQGELTGAKFCGIVFGKGCGDWELVNDWNITIPDGKPPVITPTLPPPGSPTTKVLQLTDIHLDLSYTPGTVAEDCGQFMCCTPAVGFTNDTNLQAKCWGGYHCDTSQAMFADMLDHIKETHPDIAYIMVTGDYPAHDLWLQGRDENLLTTTTGYRMIEQVFPDLPIYSSLGNHESFPGNSFPTSTRVPANLDSSWLLPELASLYSTSLEPSAVATLASNGWYSTLVQPGFRIIAINSMYCLTYNFWLVHEYVDPFGQLEWLRDELLQAEANNEKVHIISHVPSGGSDCLGAWGRAYGQLIERFENTVVAQFYGHTHWDEFYIIYDDETNTRPVSVGFVAPSVTTWMDINPAYRIYTIDDASLRVLNYQTFIFNLTLANEECQRPTFFQLYDPLTDLGMASLFPADYDDLARRLAVDDELWAKFERYYAQDVEVQVSRSEVICDLVTSNSLDHRKCEELTGPKALFA